jgi:hypothetical protein
MEDFEDFVKSLEEVELPEQCSIDNPDCESCSG